MEALFSDYCNNRAYEEAIAMPATSQVQQQVEMDSTLLPGPRPTYYAKFNRLSSHIVKKKRKTLAIKEDELTRYIKYWDPAEWQEVDDVIA